MVGHMLLVNTLLGVLITTLTNLHCCINPLTWSYGWPHAPGGHGVAPLHLHGAVRGEGLVRRLQQGQVRGEEAVRLRPWLARPGVHGTVVLNKPNGMNE